MKNKEIQEAIEKIEYLLNADNNTSKGILREK